VVAIRFVAHDGVVATVDAAPGQTLMQAATAARVAGIEAACGGSMVCGTCHVYVPEPWFSRLPAPADGERAMLDCGDHPRETSRLACQITVSAALEDAVIHTPVSQP
jgi:ferredoxin, 2Fe-2S